MKAIEDAVRMLGGVWPSDDVDAVYLYRIDDRYIAGLEGGTAPCICTRTEFVECTRRLRNEPSFDDHPDAKCFVQNDNGRWYKNTNTTNVAPYNGGKWRSQDDSYGWLFVQIGEAIGDWRDTLRLSPEEEKVEDEKDWYKRGELPPVGTVCEVFPYWHVCESIAPHQNGMVMYDRNNYEYFLATKNTRFRPLQTDRERWVEMARKATFEADEKQNYYEAIYDAGLAKMPEGK